MSRPMKLGTILAAAVGVALLSGCVVATVADTAATVVDTTVDVVTYPVRVVVD